VRSRRGFLGTVSPRAGVEIARNSLAYNEVA